MKKISFSLVLTLFVSMVTYGQSVDQLFPYAAQSHHQEGLLKMNSHAVINGTNNGRLNFPLSDIKNTSRCDGQTCKITGSRVNPYSLPAFQASSNGSSVDLGSCGGGSGSEVLSETDYQEIKLNSHCSAILNGGGNVHIDKLELNSHSDITLEAGNYWLEELKVNSNSFIYAEGEVRLFVKDKIDVNSHSELLPDTSGGSLTIFIYSNSDDSLKLNSHSVVEGYIYSQGGVDLNSHAAIKGAVNVKRLDMNSQASINYVPYPSSGSPLEPTISAGAGYVYGNAIIRLSTDSTSVTGAVFIASHDGSGTLTYRYGDNGIQALSGVVELPMNQDIQVSYDKAAQIELSLKAADDNIADGSYTTDLTFVPKQLKWTHQSNDCGADLGFVYDQHRQSCQVLAKAGQVIPLTLQAYGEGNALLAEYSATINGIEITELNANLEAVAGFNQAAVSFSQAGEAQFDSSQAIAHVALIKASVPSHCAPYAEQDGDCLLETSGDQALLGRTVPDRLEVVASVSGQLPENHLYAGRPVTFSSQPVFTVQAVDINGQALPSYHGEFAGGLNADNIGLELISDDGALDGTAMPVSVQVNADGQHQIRVSDNAWSFPKGLTAFNARAIDEQLELEIKIDSDGVGNQSLILPWSLSSRESLVDSAELRYGQLMISDLELATETEGTMPVYLQYFGQDGALVEDPDFTFSAQSALLVAESDNGALLPELTPVSDGIDVAAYAEAAEFQIRAEVETWLKTTGEAVLLDPAATLTISAGETALRGHDRVIYRREAVR